jgi:hypothetical protein
MVAQFRHQPTRVGTIEDQVHEVVQMLEAFGTVHVIEPRSHDLKNEGTHAGYASCVWVTEHAIPFTGRWSSVAKGGEDILLGEPPAQEASLQALARIEKELVQRVTIGVHALRQLR